jgi:hypothetical protein
MHISLPSEDNEGDLRGAMEKKQITDNGWSKRSELSVPEPHFILPVKALDKAMNDGGPWR